ncbi:MAG TPA: fatty acid desaturase [Coleofasciculaceae cyanobacterium]
MSPINLSLPMVNRPNSISLNTQTNSWVSMAIAITIIVLWAVSLIGLLKLDLDHLPWLLIIAAMWLRAFLHTGLFIIIHDAIHGVVCQNKQINSLMGYLTSFLYAILPYQTLAKNHRLHHNHPASEQDPDFYAANPYNFLIWYGNFMKDYQKGKQFWILFWGMSIIFWILIFFHISIANIFLFWVIPIVISSLQLFTFGTFLPHRPRKEGYSDRHRAKSSNYSDLFSFLTCYHFGYHWEHHQYPYLPWYKLPRSRKTISNDWHAQVTSR